MDMMKIFDDDTEKFVTRTDELNNKPNRKERQTNHQRPKKRGRFLPPKGNTYLTEFDPETNPTKHAQLTNCDFSHRSVFFYLACAPILIDKV